MTIHSPRSPRRSSRRSSACWQSPQPKIQSVSTNVSMKVESIADNSNVPKSNNRKRLSQDKKSKNKGIVRTLYTETSWSQSNSTVTPTNSSQPTGDNFHCTQVCPANSKIVAYHNATKLNKLLLIPFDVFSEIIFPHLTIKENARLRICSKSCYELLDGCTKLRVYKFLAENRPGLYIGDASNRVKYTYNDSIQSLPVLSTIYHFSELLATQTSVQPKLDYLNRLQSVTVLGPNNYIDEHMRASVVDWMAEVTVEYSFPPSVLHYAVQLLDRVLASTPIPRNKFQLLGCVALLARSRTIDCPMSPHDVVYMCDNQYSLNDVSNFIDQIDALIANEPNEGLVPTVLNFLAPICTMCKLPLVMYQHIDINMSLNGYSPTDAEHVLIAIFLSDLSLLDYHMLKYAPFTVAMSIIFLTRIIINHYANKKVMVSRYGIANGRKREVTQLFGPGDSRFYVEEDDSFSECPFGLKFLELFVRSSPEETAAVRSCVQRLWMLHADYFGYMFNQHDSTGVNSSYTPYVLVHHAHMFTGLREKFASRGSYRELVWSRLKGIPAIEVERFLNSVFPQSNA